MAAPVIIPTALQATTVGGASNGFQQLRPGPALWAQRVRGRECLSPRGGCLRTAAGPEIREDDVAFIIWGNLKYCLWGNL